jgi:hypothetical protein
VLSRFTAFLAVDRSEVVNQGGKLFQVVQPVEEPAGWQGGGGVGGFKSRVIVSGPPAGVPTMPMSNSAVAHGATTTRSGTIRGRSPAMPGAMDASAKPPHVFASPSRRSEARPTPEELAQLRGGAPRGPDASPPRPSPMTPMPPPMQAAPPPPPAYYAPRVDKREEAVDASAYLAKLATLARDLEAQARGGAALGALRLLRQRLTEWVEDLRSVGGQDALADAVEHEVKRLSAALANAQDAAAITTQALEVATALGKLADGSAPPPRKPGRAEFWK